MYIKYNIVNIQDSADITIKENTMIGQKIKQARLASGYTLQKLVELLGKNGLEITRAGLSNYENNKRYPKPSAILKLAKALNVKPSFFVKESNSIIEWKSFRKHSRLGKHQQEQIQAQAQSSIENHVYLYNLLYPSKEIGFGKPKRIKSINDIENKAIELRKKWKLGLNPIESMTQILEDNGGIILEQETDNSDFDGLSGIANNVFPVIIRKNEAAIDRARFNLAHELGHLYLEGEELSAKEEERFANRFASSFLVPKQMVYNELGEKRNSISLEELAILKRKYGMSMQAWIYRAHELGVISDSLYRKICISFNSRGWKKKEPGEYKGEEKATKLRQMVLRALSESIITPIKANEIIPNIVKEDRKNLDRNKMLASKLLEMPKDKRSKILEKAILIAHENELFDEELIDNDIVDLYDSKKLT